VLVVDADDLKTCTFNLHFPIIVQIFSEIAQRCIHDSRAEILHTSTLNDNSNLNPVTGGAIHVGW